MSNSDKLEELVESGKLTLRYSHKSEKKLTGAEWFVLFEKELYRPPKQELPHGDEEATQRFYRNGGANFMYDQALKAAKKASGLK